MASGQFRFAVFGDGPYYGREMGRFRRVVAALDERSLAFVIHVGDILWYPCSEDAFRGRLAAMNRIGHPVVYTPGDNEWTDCHRARPGGYDPLDRLAALRRVFFDQPERTLGGRTMTVATQAADSAYGEFVENARWVYRDIVFASLHVVGSANGMAPFAGRAPAHDEEVRRRTDAAVAWLRAAFALASERRARAVVLADPPFAGTAEERRPFEPIIAALAQEARAFGRPVLVIHGDNHEYVVDRPLVDPADGRAVVNVQRLETFGSPDIGWVEVVVDTSLATLLRFDPNVTPRWMWW